MSEIKIQAESRTEFGKGAARRLRRADKIPAVLYGHGVDPIHVTLPGHETFLALKSANALLTIDIDADNHLAIPKQVQRDPLKGFIEHVDLLIVRRGEKVTVDVRVIVTGDAISGSVVVTDVTTLPIEAEATNIPESIEVSVEGLDVGSQILASDLDLPKGATLAIDEDTLIVNVTAERTAEEQEAELATDDEAAEGEAVAEGEADADGESAEGGDDSE